MSLFFDGSAGTYYVDCGSGASLDDLGTVTFLAWIKPTDVTVLSAFIGKHDGASNGWFARIRSGGQFQIARNRATTAMSTTTTDAGLANGVWSCIGGVLDVTGGAVKAYTGNLTALMVENAGTQTVGSGAINTDASNPLVLGNRSTLSGGWDGSIGVVAVFNRVLTLEEMRSWQFNPRMLPGCVGLWMLGDNGTGTQPDLSGNGNNGTVTGATQSDNPPLRRRWGRKVLEVMYNVVAPAAGSSPYYLHYYNRLMNGVVD